MLGITQGMEGAVESKAGQTQMLRELADSSERSRSKGTKSGVWVGRVFWVDLLGSVGTSKGAMVADLAGTPGEAS